MKMIKKSLFLFIIIMIAFLTSNRLYAQVQNSDIVLTITPSVPSALDNVKAMVSSYIVDLDKSYFTWSVNDEIKTRGVGKKEFYFTMGDLATTTSISVEIETTGGKRLNKSLNISGSSVDLLWEAVNSYTPPFYKGKTLFGREGEIKVSAVPFMYNSSGQISPHTLSYSWTKDDDIQLPFSGFGKNYYIYKNSFLDQGNEVSVNVTDLNQTQEAKNKIVIIPVNPKILLYKKDDAGIKLEQSLDINPQIDKGGENIVALPYFFSPKEILSSDLEISWYINGEIVEPTTKNELRVKPSEEGGQSKIKVYIQNFKTLFQEAEKTVLVNY